MTAASLEEGWDAMVWKVLNLLCKPLLVAILGGGSNKEVLLCSCICNLEWLQGRGAVYRAR